MKRFKIIKNMKFMVDKDHEDALKKYNEIKMNLRSYWERS